jgi:hypothetical protein
MNDTVCEWTKDSDSAVTESEVEGRFVKDVESVTLAVNSSVPVKLSVIVRVLVSVSVTLLEAESAMDTVDDCISERVSCDGEPNNDSVDVTSTDVDREEEEV